MFEFSVSSLPRFATSSLMVELLGLEAHARFRAELPMELLGVVERLLNWGDFKEPSRLCTL